MNKLLNEPVDGTLNLRWKGYLETSEERLRINPMVTEAWFPLVLGIGDPYDFPTLGLLPLLRFLGQPCSHLSEESPTAHVETMTGKPFQ